MQRSYSERFSHHYQPIVGINDGKISHYEVLLRAHPDSKELNSSVFQYIESIEKTGEIAELDKWNIAVLSKQVDRKFHAFGHPCSVNLSATTVQQPGFCDYIKNILSQMTNPHLLHFEITESQPIRDFKLINNFTEIIHHFGSEVAIDDFGAGYAEFSYLDKINADIVKIDGAYIRDILRNKESKDFVIKTVLAAKEKNIKVIAEYIEDASIQDVLKKLGVNLGQGYLYSKAMPTPPSQQIISTNINESIHSVEIENQLEKDSSVKINSLLKI
jgi:FOG: EAL domain